MDSEADVLLVPEKDIKRTEKLGAGSFGEVWKGKLGKEKDVAIKTVKSHISKKVLLAEAAVMRRCDHYYLVQLIAVCKTNDTIFLVTELMKTDLLKYLQSDGYSMSSRTRVKIAAKIAAGMGYLVSKKIVHRDLAARNVLIGHDIREVKVGDFGLARIIEEGKEYYGTSTPLPMAWTAPEALSNDFKFTTMSDVWSFGVVLWEIFTNGQLPYGGIPNWQILQWITEGKRLTKPQSCPREVYETMLKCWCKHPDRRPSFGDLLLFCDEYSQGSLKERIKNMRSELHLWVSNSNDAAAELRSLADEMDVHFRRISRTKVGGTASAIAGGVLAGVGFGLSFFTFGASLGLAAVGGVIAGVGGATAGGAAIADTVLSMKRKKVAERSFEAYNDKLKDICEECVSIGTILQQRDDIDHKYKGWVAFWRTLALGSGSAAKNVGWQAVGNGILTGLRFSSQAGNIGKAGAQTGMAVFRTIGTTAGRAVHVAGGVLGILLLPVDIALLVDAAIDVHKDNPHKMSEYLRQVADGILQKCPSKETIDQMIDDTLRQLNP